MNRILKTGFMYNECKCLKVICVNKNIQGLQTLTFSAGVFDSLKLQDITFQKATFRMVYHRIFSCEEQIMSESFESPHAVVQGEWQLIQQEFLCCCFSETMPDYVSMYSLNRMLNCPSCASDIPPIQHISCK